MNKKIENSLIIFKDKPASGSLYLSCFVYFLFFAVAAAFLIGMINEFYIPDTDFIIGVTMLCILTLLFSLLFAWKVRSIIDIEREKPLVNISVEGIEILGDTFRSWTAIKSIQLVTEFDLKYVELTGFTEDDDRNYPLHGASETNEFKDLATFKSILDEYTDKVVLTGR